MSDTGLRQRRELSAETGLTEALLELATVNKEEWGGICLVHALLLQEAGPPGSSVLEWGIDFWKRRPWDPLDIISWGRARTEPGAIPRRGNGANSDSGGCCCRGGDQETRAANETRPVEIRDPDGEILEKSGLVALIAMEKRWMLSQGRGLRIPCVTAFSRPREGASIVEHEGVDIRI